MTAALFVAALAFAQNPGEAIISGKITDAVTQLPVGGANVTYCCPRLNATTDAAGVYTLHVKPDGSAAFLRVGKNGYAPLDQTSSDKTRVRLSPGASEERDFELSRGAHITGHIVDRYSGQSLAGFLVVARAQKDQYSLMYSARPSGADGSFAIVGDLVPGAYLLEIDPPSKGRITTGKTVPDRPGYGRSWFPNVPREDMAATVTLVSGEERDIELKLQKRELHHIAGVIQVPQGRESEGFTFVLTTGGGGPHIADAIDFKAGPYRIDGLDEGTYSIFATTSTGALLSQEIEVRDRNIDDLKLTLRNAITIRAVVSVKEEKTVPPKGLEFFPLPEVRGEFVTEPTDLLHTEALPPGRYWPILITPPGYAVIAVSYNGHPVVGDTAIDFEAEESTVNFMVTSRPAVLAGTVRDANQKPVPDAAVVLVPEPIPRDLRKLSATSDSNGAFRVADLAPGRYRAIVLTGSDRRRVGDPDFLSHAVNTDERIELDFGQTATLDLHVK